MALSSDSDPSVDGEKPSADANVEAEVSVDFSLLVAILILGFYFFK